MRARRQRGEAERAERACAAMRAGGEQRREEEAVDALPPCSAHFRRVVDRRGAEETRTRDAVVDAAMRAIGTPQRRLPVASRQQQPQMPSPRDSPQRLEQRAAFGLVGPVMAKDDAASAWKALRRAQEVPSHDAFVREQPDKGQGQRRSA